MNSINTIILFRHGETTNNKSDPKRGLTIRGKRETITKSAEIKKLVNGIESKIISTNNVRAIQTADLLSKNLNIKFNQEYNSVADNFLIKNWGIIKYIKNKNTYYKNKDLTEIYFDLYNKQSLPGQIKSPYTVAVEFLNIIAQLKTHAHILIFVANGGSIEAASYYQTLFKPKNNDIMSMRYIKYSEYIILYKKLK